MRLVDYLREKHKNLSRRMLKRALDQGACKVNGKIERFGSRNIDPNRDKVEYINLKTEAKEKLIISVDRIVFEDDYILVYDKNAGYPALPTKNLDRVNLHIELKKFIQNRENNKVFLEPAHRLDKDTSGLMLFAKNEKVLAQLFEMFKNKQIGKQYEALVDRVVKQGSGVIDKAMYLEKRGQGWQRWSVVDEETNKQVKTAVTEYKVVKRYPEVNYTHLKLTPKTGRMHQLRVHLTSIGHPILGDAFYAANFRTNAMPSRHLLHASSLEFIHPANQKPIKLYVKLPKDFADFLL